MRETTPRLQRIYIRMSYPGQGMAKLHASLTPPAYDEPLLVLLSRGVMPMGQPFSMLLVSDPTQNPAMKGKDATIRAGAVISGPVGSAPKVVNSGSESAAVFDFTLPAPRDGVNGASAYQIARAAGYGGTEAQWLTTLVGPAGRSAYQLARDGGYGGTEAQWLATLKGADGVSPVLSVGTVTTLAAGSPATASLSGTAGAPKLNLGVPVGAAGAPATTLLGSVTLSESNLLSVSAGVRRRVITTTFDLPIGAPLLLIPKAPPPAGYIVQAAWATKVRELTVDLTLPAITALTSYSFDNWLLRLNNG